MADECINQSTLYIVSSGSIALLRGRVASILHCFQFVIIPLSVDCGIFSKEISAILVPHWNLLSSWEGSILSQMFLEAVCMATFLILYTWGHGSDWNTWILLNNFANIVHLYIWVMGSRWVQIDTQVWQQHSKIHRWFQVFKHKQIHTSQTELCCPPDSWPN